MGPVKAQAIIDYRTKNGNFKSLEDVKKVNGIGDATFEKMKKDISLTGATTPLTKSQQVDRKVDDVKAKTKEVAKDTKAAAKEAVADTKAAAKDTKEKVKEKTADTKAAVKEKAADTKAAVKESAADTKAASTDSIRFQPGRVSTRNDVSIMALYVNTASADVTG